MVELVRSGGRLLIADERLRSARPHGTKERPLDRQQQGSITATVQLPSRLPLWWQGAGPASPPVLARSNSGAGPLVPRVLSCA